MLHCAYTPTKSNLFHFKPKTTLNYIYLSIYIFMLNLCSLVVGFFLFNSAHSRVLRIEHTNMCNRTLPRTERRRIKRYIAQFFSFSKTKLIYTLFWGNNRAITSTIHIECFTIHKNNKKNTILKNNARLFHRWTLKCICDQNNKLERVTYDTKRTKNQ